MIKAKTATATATATTNNAAAPVAKAAAPVREVSNKVKPQGTDPAVKSAKPTAQAAPNAAKATAQAAPVIAISTGNDKLDKEYKVGDQSILPQEYIGKPVVDQLKEAYISEEKGQLGWKQLANYYGWSIKPIQAAMIATNDWPMVTKKDAKGKETTKPMGYKAIYNEEKEAGTPGLGYWLNRAANRFAEHKPEALRRNANKSQTIKPGDKKYIGGTNPRKDRKSNFDIACDIIAGMEPQTVAALIKNIHVNDALRDYLADKHKRTLKG